jgi:hypothetical protein
MYITYSSIEKKTNQLENNGHFENVLFLLTLFTPNTQNPKYATAK